MEAEGIKERLLKFLNHLGIGESVFEKKTGLGRALITNMNENLSTKSIVKICSVYPELNITWLILGQGDMLLNQSPSGKSPDKKLASSAIHGIQDKAMDAILGLIDIGKTLADNNTELTSMLKSRISTGNVIHGIPEALLPKFAQILSFVAEVGVGKNWDSAEDGANILHNKFFGTEQVAQVKGSQDDSGTKRKKNS